MKNTDTSITIAINRFTRDLFEKGYWQILMFVIIQESIAYACAFIILSDIFTSGKMNFKCNVTNSNYSSEINVCGMKNKYTNHTIKCNSNYIFSSEPNFVETSMIADFQLICDREILNGLSHSMVMLGLFIGGITGPILADKYGRRLIVFGSFLIAGIFGITMSFVTNFYVILVFNLILGIMREAALSVGFVYGLEFIPDTHQSYYGMISQVLWSVNIIVFGILAYCLRQWRYLQLFGSIPIFFMSFLIIFVPESPRWLITTAHFETLRTLIDKFVNKVNDQKISSLNNIERLKKAYVQHMKRSKSKIDKTVYTAIDIVKSKTLLIWSVILTITWIFMMIAYFSMTILTVHFPGNKYFTFILPVCSEIPGYFLAYSLIKRSRNLTFFVAQLVTSVCLISLVFIDFKYNWLIIVLTVISKCCLAGLFYITVICAFYIYPTTIRTFGTSLPSAISKLLGVSIPYFVKLYSIYTWLPMLMIGIGALVVGTANIFYPDWINRPLPETLRELDELKQRIGFKMNGNDNDIEDDQVNFKKISVTRSDV